jgi:hypothetical protein
VKKLKLSNCQKHLLVDDEDFENCKLWTWNEDNEGNVRACIESMSVKLANYIMDTDLMYDHKDQDKLNNQKNNLRPATYSQNGANRNKWSKDVTSQYKGVCFKKNSWYATIKVNYKQYHLGCFNTEIEAAKSYNKAARKYFGEFAVLNNFRERKEKKTDVALAKEVQR